MEKDCLCNGSFFFLCKVSIKSHFILEKWVNNVYSEHYVEQHEHIFKRWLLSEWYLCYYCSTAWIMMHKLPFVMAVCSSIQQTGISARSSTSRVCKAAFIWLTGRFLNQTQILFVGYRRLSTEEELTAESGPEHHLPTDSPVHKRVKHFTTGIDNF